MPISVDSREETGNSLHRDYAMIIQPSPPLTQSQTESLAFATLDLRPERGFVMDIAVILDHETICAQVLGLDDGVLVNNVRVVK